MGFRSRARRSHRDDQPRRKREPSNRHRAGTNLVLGDIPGEDVLVTVMDADRRVVRIVVAMRMVPVFENHAHRLQVDMPSCRAPGDGKEDGEKGADARHGSAQG